MKICLSIIKDDPIVISTELNAQSFRIILVLDDQLIQISRFFNLARDESNFFSLKMHFPVNQPSANSSMHVMNMQYLGTYGTSGRMLSGIAHLENFY